MKTKLLFTALSVLSATIINAQMVKKLPRQIDKTPETISSPLAKDKLPERTNAKPASKSSWVSKPQFEVNIEKEKAIHWYAIENANNTIYWSGVKLNRILICLKKGATINDIKFLREKYSLLPTRDSSMFPEIMNFFVFEIPNGNKEKMLEIISDAQTFDKIEFAEPDIIITSQSCFPNDPSYLSDQWGPYNVWADSAWCYETGIGSWQMVGIIDDACDYYHPDLYNTVWYGYDFADNDNDPTPFDTTADHGTHVSGISSAQINNGIGISGMCNDTTYFAKVSDDATTSFSSTAIINAINFFSSQSRIRVVNMSFGSPVINAAEQSACLNAWNSGVLLIAASGNNNTSPVLYPAGFTTVIAVGSVDQNYNVSTFSSFGSDQELTAPGGDLVVNGGPGDIFSTLPSNNYGTKAGTSMAAPLVTGLAGLMFAVNPALSNSQARTILQQNVWDYGAAGWDQYFGYGVVCAYCAVIDASLTTGENNISNDISWNISPNPSAGIFSISSNSNINDFEISVVNILGEEIYKTKIISNTTELDLSNQPNGVYFVKITSKVNSITKRIIISK